MQIIAAVPVAAPMARAAPANYETSLIAGGEADGKLLAGLRVTLQPEWKTYWRMPGDAGIPPQFDWSGSDNVGAVRVQYPTPGRFRDASGETIGYHDEVVFPLLVTPKDAVQPVLLRLKLFFAVCRDLCIPAKAELALDFATSRPDARVTVWQGRVPRRVPTGEGGMVAAGRIEQQGGSLKLVLYLAGTPLDIFVESETGAYFGKPERGRSDAEMILPIANLTDATKLRGKPVIVTVSYADKAVEQHIILD